MDTSAKAHAFVADLDEPALSGDDRHHLARVLRLRDGDLVTVGDGAGAWRLCRFGDTLVPVGDIEHDEPPPPPLTIAFALVKGERPEWVVQKLTELGIDRIAPFVAERSVVHWDASRAAHHHARLFAVARMAAMQSRRATLPVVEAVCTFAEVASRRGVALADARGEPPSLAHPVVAVGPEGGWSDAERARGLPTVAVGTHVLRAETAAVATGALLAGLRAGLVREPRRDRG